MDKIAAIKINFLAKEIGIKADILQHESKIERGPKSGFEKHLRRTRGLLDVIESEDLYAA